MHIYNSFAWYQLQLLLNDGNGQYAVDWPYAISYPINDLTWDNVNAKPRIGTAGLLTLWMVKALQNDSYNDAAGPWEFVAFPGQVSTWTDVSTSQKLQIMNAYTSAWFASFNSMPANQFLALPMLSPGGGNPTALQFGKDLIYGLPELRYAGMDTTLLNQITSWASTVWPGYNWSQDSNAPCVVYNLGQILCSGN